MKKTITILFFFSLLIGNAQNGRYNGWLLGGNSIGTNTFNIGTNDAQDFVFKTNNTERLRLYSTGIFQMATIASSLAAATVGTKSGHYWYDGGTNGLGFAFYKSRYDNGNIMTLTDSVIYSAHKLKRLGGVDDGYWLGTSSNHNTNIVVNSNGANAPAICTSTSGGVIINPLFGASGYTTNASLKVQASGGLTNIFSVTNASSAILFGVNNSNNTLIANKCVVGSTANPTSNFEVHGDFSVSTTFTNNGLLKCLTTLSVGGIATFASSVVIGASSTPNANFVTVGTGSVSGTFTTAGIFKPTAGILGTATNDNATAGNVGEATNSLVAVGSALTLTTTVVTNVATLTLTAGDWDLSGNINVNETTSTVTERVGGITSTAATIPTDGSEIYNGNIITTTSAKNTISCPRKRFSLSTSTVIYLVVKCTFSAGTEVAYGTLTARRIR